VGVACHGLATAIEQGPDSSAVTALLDTCARAASVAGPLGEPVFAGLCCTHYGMIQAQIHASLTQHTARGVITVDPNERLVEEVVGRVRGEVPAPTVEARTPSVRVISKVELKAAQRSGIGHIVQRVSPATARALDEYQHVPDLF
jgi:glutamate racemase